jgi:hypothetical protein
MTEPSSLQSAELVNRSALQAGLEDSAGFRIGRVTRVDDPTITVAIGGTNTLVAATYLTSYIPILGENVVLGRFGASWIALGGQSVVPPNNPVLNYSFETDPLTTSPPSNWAYLNDAGLPGAPIFKTDFAIPMIDGSQCANTNGFAVASAFQQIAYSTAIPVAPGETWSASAYTTWYTQDSTTGGNIELWLFWSTLASDTPTIALLGDATRSHSINLTFAGGAPSPNWVLLRHDSGIPEGARVPATRNWLRVGLVANMVKNIDVFWDRVVARKILNADGSVFSG